MQSFSTLHMVVPLLSLSLSLEMSLGKYYLDLWASILKLLFSPSLYQVAEKILDKKELEFYKWDRDLSQLLQNVRDKLNKVAEVIFFVLLQSSLVNSILFLFPLRTWSTS